MARVHGMPGRYTAAEAGRRSDSFIVLLLAGLMLTGVAAGVWLSSGVWLPAASVVVGLLLGRRILARHFTALNRERRTYLRGANGEALIGHLLGLLPHNWHVFHGVMIDQHQDVDHVLVGPAGVFAISTKNYRGWFTTGPQGELLHNGEPSSLARQCVAQAMKLRDRLSESLGGEQPYVHAVLAVPFGWIDVRNPHEHAHVLHQDNLLDALEAMPRRLSGREVSRYARALRSVYAALPQAVAATQSK